MQTVFLAQEIYEKLQELQKVRSMERVTEPSSRGEESSGIQKGGTMVQSFNGHGRNA